MLDDDDDDDNIFSCLSVVDADGRARDCWLTTQLLRLHLDLDLDGNNDRRVAKIMAIAAIYASLQCGGWAIRYALQYAVAPNAKIAQRRGKSSILITFVFGASQSRLVKAGGYYLLPPAACRSRHLGLRHHFAHYSYLRRNRHLRRY